MIKNEVYKNHFSLSSYLANVSQLLANMEITESNHRSVTMEDGMEKACDLFLSVFQKKKKVILIGNGGSATIVQHMQNDLCKCVGMRALVFDDIPLLTALANDEGYERVFEAPTQLWADPEDLMVAVSSSGNSKNILRAVQASRLLDCHIVTFTGFKPQNPLRYLGDVNFYIKSCEYGYVEASHSVITHAITDFVAYHLSYTNENSLK